MKQDYLWDKSGVVDPEIEGLENALAAFRYQETAPPALSAKVLAFPERVVEKTTRWRFSFRFAFAACAAAILIAFGVLFQLSNNKTSIGNDSAKADAPQSHKEIQKDSIDDVEQLQIPPVGNVEKAATLPQIKAPKQIAQQTAKQNAVEIRQRVPTNPKQNKIVAADAKIKKPSETLTAEEKHAYDQLMLALSITGSKLKIVKDKVDGVEQNAVFKDGR